MVVMSTVTRLGVLQGKLHKLVACCGLLILLNALKHPLLWCGVKAGRCGLAGLANVSGYGCSPRGSGCISGYGKVPELRSVLKLRADVVLRWLRLALAWCPCRHAHLLVYVPLQCAWRLPM
jgi:hypothetical protein